MSSLEKRILFSSVCKPIGPTVGDSQSVGYELLHGQVTWAQGIYSPRVVHKQFSLDYIAENLDTHSTVMHYPSKRKFISEIKKGYEYIGMSFVLATHHHIFEMCRLVRKYAPATKIILGGYGTVMTDEELEPYCDHICREEGVRYVRRLLDEPSLDVADYIHPDIRSRMKIFGLPVAHTAIVFAGLGCPNGCDFCCTSHFFKRKHIKLLSTGAKIYRTMARHLEIDPNIDHTVLDEDFILNKSRADEFRGLCIKNKTIFSMFAFASVKALSQYSIEELLEMGVGGVWIGYEGKSSGYSKHDGRNIDELITELQDHGITVLSSMILGIPYQTEEIAREEFKNLLDNKPALTQYLIYSAIPGTPLYDKVQKEGGLRAEDSNNRLEYYKKCVGFYSTVEHPFMDKRSLEDLQKEFYRNDFMTLGPSILRIAQVKLAGFKKYKNHRNPMLKLMADGFQRKLASSLAILPVGIVGPQISVKNRIKYMTDIIEIFRHVRWHQKLYILAAPLMMLGAFFCWVGLKTNRAQHPYTRVHKFPGRQGKFQAYRYIDHILLKLFSRRKILAGSQ
jgi:haloalkane dehalogenase